MPPVHTGYGYSIYGRDISSEISATLDAYIANSSKWSSTNLTLTGSLASQTVTNAATLKPMYSSSMGSAAISLVPTTSGQALRLDELALAAKALTENPELPAIPTTASPARLEELALAAKALIESPEIDESANSQIASGMSAAMGGGHNSVTAIKDSISFDQKLQAKQIAFAAYAQSLDAYNKTFDQKLQAKNIAFGAYAQALDAYYKTYTATGSQLSQVTSDGAAKAALMIPTVAPFESQLAADILSNWQDTLNTGQLRDQQIRQTYDAGAALDSFNPGTNFSTWNAEYALAYCGIKSQAAAAKAT
jgi:hypothetical protein